ncbi:cAMP-dependent protein kinase inhibitor alpha [Anabrus simplex]|uniref:cAMP-dependent protein kinase inhibitor alpha n=1 Tax=Anabrus simplex TaxID=316456 RepID=UPI0034DCEC51
MKPAPPTSGRSRKCARPARRLTRRAVLKMLTAMEQSPDSNHDPVQDFLSSGRTGRRNALPDILGEHANTSTAELPECLQKLTANDPSPGGSGTAQDNPTPSPRTPSSPTGEHPPEAASSNS